MSSKQHPSFLVYSLAQCLYWSAGCAVITFAVVFLTGKGFSAAAAGLVCSVAAALGFALTSVLSSAVDASKIRTSSAGYILFFIAVLSLFGAIVVREANFLSASCYTLALAAIQAAVFVYNKLYTDLQYNGIELDFGKARGLGSLAFSLASVFLGILVRQRGAGSLPLLAAFMIMAQCACVFCLCRTLNGEMRADKISEKAGISLFSFLTRYKRFTCFLLGASIVSAINLTLTAFLIQIVERAGGNVGTFGFLNAYLALIEVPVMFFYTRIRRRFHPKKLVIIAMAFYCAKILGFALASNMVVLFLAATMHALSFGLFTPACVDYVAEVIPRADSAKGQGLMALSPTLFSCVTLAAFGLLQSSIGFVPVLLFYSVLSVLGLFLCVRSA